MKKFKHIVLLAIAALLVSCTGVNEDLEKVIPADAAGVVCVDINSVLTKSTILIDDKIAIPAQLQAVVDDNDASPLNQLLTNLPVMGINTDSKAYVFFTTKTFSQVVVMALNDEDAARKFVERSTGTDLQEVEGLDCVYQEDVFYTIKDKTLMMARVSRPMEVAKAAKAAKRMLARNTTSIADDKDVKECIDADNDLNAYLKVEALKILLKGSKTYREVSQKMPLVEIFTESDVKAYVASLNLNEHDAVLDVKVKVDDNSEYIKLLTSTLNAPGADFLKAIPESMEYILAMSVKGDNFVKLPQIVQLIELFKKQPFIGRLDIESILATIDGPVAVGLASDDYLDDWNAVIAAKSNNPDAVVQHIARFASALGQQPEVYNDSYIYQYENKMIAIGVKEGILNVKMLNYEQTEGYSYDIVEARTFFDKSPMGLYVQASKDGKGGSFHGGLTDMKNMTGHFTPSDTTGNASLALLNVLCGIKPLKPYDNLDDQYDYLPENVKLMPVN